jgi:hypothetical protein
MFAVAYLSTTGIHEICATELTATGHDFTADPNPSVAVSGPIVFRDCVWLAATMRA